MLTTFQEILNDFLIFYFFKNLTSIPNVFVSLAFKSYGILSHTNVDNTRMLIIILDYSVLLYCNCHNPFRSYTFMLLFCPQVRGSLLINMHDIYVYVIKVLLFWFCLKNCKLGLLEQTFFLMNLLMKRK